MTVCTFALLSFFFIINQSISNLPLSHFYSQILFEIKKKKEPFYFCHQPSSGLFSLSSRVIDTTFRKWQRGQNASKAFTSLSFLGLHIWTVFSTLWKRVSCMHLAYNCNSLTDVCLYIYGTIPKRDCRRDLENARNGRHSFLVPGEKCWIYLRSRLRRSLQHLRLCYGGVMLLI